MAVTFAVIVTACSVPARPTRPITLAFSEVIRSAQSKYDGATPAIAIGTTDSSIAPIRALVPGLSAPSDRVLVAAFLGSQRTGGYAIAVTAIERDGDVLVARATFTTPAPDAVVTQVITSPVDVVSIALADAAGVRVAVLLDQTGKERARTTIR